MAGTAIEPIDHVAAFVMREARYAPGPSTFESGLPENYSHSSSGGAAVGVTGLSAALPGRAAVPCAGHGRCTGRRLAPNRSKARSVDRGEPPPPTRSREHAVPEV